MPTANIAIDVGFLTYKVNNFDHRSVRSWETPSICGDKRPKSNYIDVLVIPKKGQIH